MNSPEQPQMNVDFSQTTPQTCDKCENKTFVQAFILRKLSALLSPTGTAAKIPIPVFACLKCDHVNDSFLPKEDFNDDPV